MNTAQFFEHILQLRRQYVEHMNKELERFNLSTAQWLVLKNINKQAETTLVEIAKQQQLEKPTVTKIVQKLVEESYIQVRPGIDKREKLLSLTAKGNSIYNDVFTIIQSTQQQLLKDVPDSLIEQMNDSFITIQEQIKKL